MFCKKDRGEVLIQGNDTFLGLNQILKKRRHNSPEDNDSDCDFNRFKIMENPLLKGRLEKIPLSCDRLTLSGSESLRLITSTHRRGNYDPMRANFKTLSDRIFNSDSSCTIAKVFLQIEINKQNPSRCFDIIYNYATDWCNGDIPPEIIVANDSSVVHYLDKPIFICLNKRGEMPVTNFKRLLMDTNGNIVHDIIQKHFFLPVVFIGSTSMEDQEVLISQSLHVVLNEFEPYTYNQSQR